MKKPENKSSKFSLRSAEKELELPLGTPIMGERVGGLSAFPNSLRRGYGDETFGVDENGLWLGAADFEDAPFRVGIDGAVTITDVEDADDSAFFNAKVLAFKNNGLYEIIIGDPDELPPE